MNQYDFALRLAICEISYNQISFYVNHSSKTVWLCILYFSLENANKFIRIIVKFIYSADTVDGFAVVQTRVAHSIAVFVID